jgi:hypothetical protein
MKTKDCIPETRVYFKHSSTYGSMKIKRLVPKSESKTSYFVVEVYHSSDNNFDFALVKQYALSLLTNKEVKPFTS